MGLLNWFCRHFCPNKEVRDSKRNLAKVPTFYCGEPITKFYRAKYVPGKAISKALKTIEVADHFFDAVISLIALDFSYRKIYALIHTKYPDITQPMYRNVLKHIKAGLNMRQLVKDYILNEELQLSLDLFKETKLVNKEVKKDIADAIPTMVRIVASGEPKELIPAIEYLGRLKALPALKDGSIPVVIEKTINTEPKLPKGLEAKMTRSNYRSRVIGLYQAGLSTPEIAKELGVSGRYVGGIVTNIVQGRYHSSKRIMERRKEVLDAREVMEEKH
jgi:hypothetical protein